MTLVTPNYFPEIRLSLFLTILLFSITDAAAQLPRLVIPAGHTSIVVDARYSPNGKYIVTAGWDNVARVWQAADGRLLFELKAHTGSVTSASFSPDSKLILTTSKDGLALLWDAQTGGLRARLKGHKDVVNAGAFSPDGRFAATASSDGQCIIWQAADGKLLHRIDAHTGSIVTIDFSIASDKLLTASSDHTAAIWDIQGGYLLYRLLGHRGAIRGARFSADGNFAATASADSTVRLWRVNGGLSLSEFVGHQGPVNDVVFGGPGQLLSCSDDSTVRIWGIGGSSQIMILRGHLGPVKSVSPGQDKKLLVSASEDGKAIIWDDQTGRQLQVLKGHTGWLNGARFSPDGTKILTCSNDRTSKIWSAASGRLFADLRSHVPMPTHAAISPDGRIIVAIYQDSLARVWDGGDGRLLRCLSGPVNPLSPVVFSPGGKFFLVASCSNDCLIYRSGDYSSPQLLRGHTDWLTSAAFSPDEKYVATGSWDSTVRIWQIATGKCLREMRGQKNVVASVAFDPAGRSVTSASWDHTAMIWKLFGTHSPSVLRGHRDEVRNAAYSPNGLYVVTSSWDSTAKIWLSRTGKLIHTLKGHRDFVNEAGFSPDGAEVYTVSMDGTAKIWDLVSGRCIRTLSGHSRAVIHAIFSKDSKRIYTASWDNTIKIWEVKTGKLQQSLDSHEAPLESMDMDHEGRDLISASEDNTIKKWSAVSGSLQYSFFPVDRDDYLLMDGWGRYDGTEGARRMLYFACGPRLEDLEQFKNLMWEPSLAKKCNGLDEEPITASRLSDIKVCNYSPLVEQSMRGDSVFEFKITPGAGGVGRLDLCVNRKQVASFEPQNLQKENGSFWLSVDRRAVQDYFLPGEENTVYLKISTLDGQTLTRGNPIASTAAPRPATSANVYLIIAGVSKYKGKDLRLNYAAKDAADFSAVVTAAARKLFDIDGIEHVHPYLFLTDSLARQPLKRNIASVVDTISRLARAQDILLVFFAGHGLMEPNKKTYYVLTSDAADFNISGIEDQVAVSTDELNQWSSRIKANKQVLILDACSSGQVISNLSTLFNRGDVPADQQRALEELKDKTGLYILCASASGQAARESGLYNQGLLTYALLSGIKFGGAMKNDKFIDVSMWFNFASQEVRKLAREAGSDQQPQILGSASFDIGIADNDILSRINLFSKKKIFLRSRFVDDEVLLTDGLNFTGVVDRELNNLSEKGKESPLVFVPDNGADSAFSLHGKYQVFGDSVRLKVYLIMGQKKLLYSFEQRGLVNDRDELAAALVSRIRKYIVNFTFKE